ncbi:phage tail assembly protein [Pseudomonas fluorescens group sp. PF-69]
MNIVETLTLEFRTPIVIGKDAGALTYTHVELREPTAGDLEKAQRADTPVGGVINLITEIGGVPRLVAQKMCGRDMAIADKFFSSFRAGPETAADGQN